MSNEIEIHQQSATALAVSANQTMFTPEQVSMLEHIGVENASEGDLKVFFHHVQRTGLDPFARQIYMIGRPNRREVNGAWVSETKQTIQTGIDGYRLIGRRAADRAGVSISVKPPQWAHPDGGWRDLWLEEWGTPAAAKVTITRQGEEFTAIALFSEYKQTNRQGKLTRMWEQRPAGQIAKCAEALAWRLAFPHDLAGIYTDEEMAQADNPSDPMPAQANPAPAPMAEPEPEPNAPAAERINQQQWESIIAQGEKAGLEPRAVVQRVQQIVDRPLNAPNEIMVAELTAILEALKETPNA